jgi:hypothetical protein
MRTLGAGPASDLLANLAYMFVLLLWGRERSQGADVTAKSVLNASVCDSILRNNVPVVVTGVPYGKSRVRVQKD